MTTHLVTFATDDMSRSRELCVESATQHGVDLAMPLDMVALERTSAYQDNPALFRSARGVGYWAWKPALIEGVLNLVLNENDGDILIYSDAGVEFINNVSHIIDRMDQDIFLFGNNWEHAHWCKRDTAEAIWPCNNESRCPSPHYEFWDKFGKQSQASVILFRVSDYTRAFVKEWLDWCLFEGGRLIDDSPSRLPNHPEFREHRHDQAILTTLAYREGIKLHYWPAVYNKGGSPELVYEKLPEYAGDDYPVLFSHHRRRNHEWKQVA